MSHSRASNGYHPRPDEEHSYRNGSRPSTAQNNGPVPTHRPMHMNRTLPQMRSQSSQPSYRSSPSATPTNNFFVPPAPPRRPYNNNNSRFNGPPPFCSPQPHSSQQYGPLTHGSQQYGPQRHGLQQYAPQPHGSQQYGPQPHGSPQYGPESHGSQQYGSQPFGSQQYGTQPYGPQQHGSQQHGSQQHGLQQHSSQLHGPQAHGSQSHGSSQKWETQWHSRFPPSSPKKRPRSAPEAPSTPESKPQKSHKKKKAAGTRNNGSRKTWTNDDCILALKIEKEYNKRFKNQSLIIKFPDIELNRSIVENFHPAIVSVHFQQPSTPRFCFVTLKEGVDGDKLIEVLNTITFGEGFLTAEYKKDRDEEQTVGPDDINPLALYIGNLAQEITKDEMVKMFPHSKRIDIGYAKKMKYTRYAFVTFRRIQDSIDSFKNNHNKQVYSKSLIVRFLRLHGTVGVPGLSKNITPEDSDETMVFDAMDCIHDSDTAQPSTPTAPHQSATITSSNTEQASGNMEAEGGPVKIKEEFVLAPSPFLPECEALSNDSFPAPFIEYIKTEEPTIPIIKEEFDDTVTDNYMESDEGYDENTGYPDLGLQLNPPRMHNRPEADTVEDEKPFVMPMKFEPMNVELEALKLEHDEKDIDLVDEPLRAAF